MSPSTISIIVCVLFLAFIALVVISVAKWALRLGRTLDKIEKKIK